MTSDVRWLKASKRGNGVGVAIVRSGTGPVLILNVLPKIASWRDGEHSGSWYIDITEALSRARDHEETRVAVTVHEGDVLRVPAEFVAPIKAAAAESPRLEDTGVGEEPETSDADALDPTDHGELDRLFDEVPEPRRHPDSGHAEQALRSNPEKVQQLWDLVSANDGGILDRLSIRNQELLGTVAPHLPALKPLIMHAFVDELESAIQHRRRSFQPRSEDLLSIRGRIDIRSLAYREAWGTLPVTCHFDELSHDSPPWQILRAANRLIVGDDQAQVGDSTLAAQLDNRLSDVAVIPTPRAVQSLASLRGSPEERSLRRLLQLARCILTLRYPVGALSDDATDFAIEIKIPTSGLWETLLTTALNKFTDYRAHTPDTGIQLRLFDQGHEKKPDIVLTAADHRTRRVEVADVEFVIDAKYKVLTGPGNPKKKSGPTMSWLSMPDQYQCFAYSTLLDAPTLFITVGSGDSCATRTSPIPGQSENGHAVGIAPVPFPAPGATALEQNDIEKVVAWLEDNANSTPQTAFHYRH